MDFIAVLHRSIAELVKRFQSNPFDFLYERDLQAMLFSLMVDGFGPVKIAMKGGYWKSDHYGEGDTIRTVPVRCEYPSGYVFDLAIIDPQMIRSYDLTQWQAAGLKNDAFWNQPVMAAVELKYCQLGDRVNLKKAECSVDIEKLKRYQEERGERPFCGISLLFIQSESMAFKFQDGAKARDEHLASGLTQYVVTPRNWWQISY